MSRGNQVLRVTELPAGITTLANTAELEGYAHVTRLIDDFKAAENRFTQPGEALFACFAGEHLVGVGGVNQDPYDANPHAGRVRRVYVHPDYRRQRLASALMATLERHASRHFETLNLFTSSEQACSFYRHLGYLKRHDADKISHTKILDPDGTSSEHAG